jgi:hypothetical protein
LPSKTVCTVLHYSTQWKELLADTSSQYYHLLLAAEW